MEVNTLYSYKTVTLANVAVFPSEVQQHQFMAFIKYGKYNAIQSLLAVGKSGTLLEQSRLRHAAGVRAAKTPCAGENKVPNYERQSKKKRSQCHPRWLTDSWSLASSIQTHHIVSGCLDPKKEPKEKIKAETRGLCGLQVLYSYITSQKSRG